MTCSKAKRLFIGLLALSLSLSGLGLWLSQSTLAQTQAVPAEQLELERLAQLAEQQVQQGQPEQAIATWKKALLIARQSNSKKIETATILLNIGDVYNGIGQPQKSLEYYTQALAITKETHDRGGEARTLTSIGLVYIGIGQPQKALEYFNQALPITKEVNNKIWEARTLTSIGWVYSGTGQPQKAIEYFNQALPITKEIKDGVGEVRTLASIGWIYNGIGQPQKAIEYFNQALPITKEIKDRIGEAGTLTRIGRVYNGIGQPQKALEYFNQALPITKEVKDRIGEAGTLASIGRVYDSIGQPQKALEYFNQALPITKEVHNRSEEAATLSRIGEVYRGIGQLQKALEYDSQSLFIFREVQDRNGEATTLSNIGEVYRAIGQPQKALKYYTQALPILREVQDRTGEFTTVTSIGWIYSNIGQPQKALEYHNQALLVTKEVNDRYGKATTLTSIGDVYNDIGQPQKALEYFNQALPIFREIKDRSLDATIFGSLAFLEQSRGNLQEALTHIQGAIEIIETTRTEIVRQDFRTSFFASQQGYYTIYIDILMQLHKQQPSKGFNALALQTSERARARSLLDLLKESQADIRQGVDPKLLEQEKKLQFQLNAIEKRRIELYRKNLTKLQIANFESEYDTAFSQYQDLKTKIRSNSPRYAALTQPQPLTLTELKQQVLDDNTVLLEYFLGKDRSYLWAVTPSGMSSYELPKQSEIAAATQQFHKLVTNTTAQPSEISKAGIPLTKMLLDPVAKQLGQKRLLIVSNGALQYLPFAALPAPTGSQLLLSEHEIINLPSASILATLRHELNGRKPAAKTVAVFADPVFSRTDQRVSKNGSASTPDNSAQESINSLPLSMQTLRSASQDAGINFGRLLGTRQEAENILKLIPADTQTQAFDFKASRENVLNSNLSQYRIIHFATHGILNTTRPELSAVVLSLVDQKGNSQNGFLRLNDIFNLNLPAELVVLSACQTGLGQNIRGEGLIGLTRGFMYAGTPRVLVSLWNVNDESTAVLMTHFYKAMLEQKLPPAAALRAAQLKMQQETKWKSPYYWAAFTLQGEWK